jgi:hypothetical protein
VQVSTTIFTGQTEERTSSSGLKGAADGNSCCKKWREEEFMAHADRKSTNLTFSEPSTLCGAIHQRLNGYMLCASTAGVAILACSLPAEGSPVCLQVGFTLQGTDTYALNPVLSPVAPFNIAQTFSSPSSHPTFAGGRLFLTPNFPDAETVTAENDLPADLPAGASIGPGGNFGEGKSYGLLFSTNRSRHQGNLEPGKTNYFGYRFLISGRIHYGWVRIKESGTHTDFQTQVLASGYESAPDTAIAAGVCTSALPLTGAASTRQNGAPNSGNQAGGSAANSSSDTPRPTSLGMLALGIQGLPLWRR